MSDAARGGPGRRLERRRDGRPAAPVRLVHLGLGNFFRAHAAWYTDRAPDAADWGIAAFTGRSAATAVSLAEQDGLYTLLVRAPDGPHPEVVASLSAVHRADDLAALREYFERPQVSIVTLTVTEAGYWRDRAGGLDVAADDVRADIDALAEDPAHAVVTTAPGKLVAGLLARRAAHAGPVSIVPNDNVPDNGAMLARVVADLGSRVDATLAEWLQDNVSFVTTMVDRITPRTTEEDVSDVRALTGIDDPQVVPTEPYSEWVLSGSFPGGRPAWDAAGARLVEDVVPYEQRKLLLLNGSHSVMAYAGSVLGHTTVAEAIADPHVRDWVEQWSDAAQTRLSLPARELASYRSALLERFSNNGIRHLLGQIAADGSQKVPIRAVPVILGNLADGQVATGATRLVAAWIVHLRGSGVPVSDAHEGEVRALVAGSVSDATGRVLTWLGLPVAELQEVVEQQVRDLGVRRT